MKMIKLSIYIYHINLINLLQQKSTNVGAGSPSASHSIINGLSLSVRVVAT